MLDKSKEKKDIRIRNTGVFKLKDKQGRNFQGINLKMQFGFLPEVIIIEKVPGQNNKLIVRAVLTPEEIEKEDKLKKERKQNVIKQPSTKEK